MDSECSWRKKIRACRWMVGVGAVISGHTTHGCFVSAGRARLSTLPHLGPTLMGTTVYSDTFSDILCWNVLRYFCLPMEGNVLEHYLNALQITRVVAVELAHCHCRQKPLITKVNRIVNQEYELFLQTVLHCTGNKLLYCIIQESFSDRPLAELTVPSLSSSYLLSRLINIPPATCYFRCFEFTIFFWYLVLLRPWLDDLKGSCLTRWSFEILSFLKRPAVISILVSHF